MTTKPEMVREADRPPVPNFVAVRSDVLLAAVKVLQTLPYHQVEAIVPALMGSRPIHLPEE